LQATLILRRGGFWGEVWVGPAGAGSAAGLPRFEAAQLTFERIELVACPSEQLALQFEFLACDQLKLLKRLGQQRLEIAFHVGSRPGAQKRQNTILQVVKKGLSIHSLESITGNLPVWCEQSALPGLLRHPRNAWALWMDLVIPHSRGAA